ncbi:hypothetical protein EJ03DRAFT_354575 [Teratosphaeria nubilosa]|uniref:Uncharacterized protein n=1 Tax=Teratosphaeria nubilosa TaxID=161662 RepID=A0A6G1KYR7_9PEZI|nr:hypothetical protein EJ03DRAFT_354575 [Teratosphaeria nubilosa]
MVNDGSMRFWTQRMRKTLQAFDQRRRNYTNEQKAAIFFEMFHNELPVNYASQGRIPHSALRTQYLPYTRSQQKKNWVGINYLEGMSNQEKDALNAELMRLGLAQDDKEDHVNVVNQAANIDRAASSSINPYKAHSGPRDGQKDQSMEQYGVFNNEGSIPISRRASRLVARQSAASARAYTALTPTEIPPIVAPDLNLAYPYTRATDPEDLGYDDEKKARTSRSFGKKLNEIIKPHERRRRPDLRATDNLFDFNFNDPNWIAMAFICKRTVAGKYSPGVYENLREIAEDFKGDAGWK